MNRSPKSSESETRRHLTTIGGWSPGLRELAGSQILACGCMVGIYNTWSDDIVAVTDAVGEHCQEHHVKDRVLSR